MTGLLAHVSTDHLWAANVIGLLIFALICFLVSRWRVQRRSTGPVPGRTDERGV